MLRFAFAFVALVTAFVAPLRAQPERAHVTGPFVQAGGVAGSVTRDADPDNKSHSGSGWGVGAGYNVTSWFTVVGNYTIFSAHDEAANSYNLEQPEVGIRLRLGGQQTPLVFYVEGGGALRRATLSTLEVFGETPPAGLTDRVRVSGWAGWFGPGVQIYAFGPRVPIDVAVGWAWGSFDRAKISGSYTALDDPIAMTTLRLRAGISATIF